MNQWKSTILFSLLFGLVVMAGSELIKKLPAIQHVENSLFDQLQDKWVLDSGSVEGGARQNLVRALDKVWLINLDGGVYNQKNELERMWVAETLNQLGKLNYVKAIFLDHIFKDVEVNPHNDEKLQNVVAELQDRLVIPYIQIVNSSGSFFDLPDSSRAVCRSHFPLGSQIAGFFSGEILPGDHRIRFSRLANPGRSAISCASKLANYTHPDRSRRVEETIPNHQMEINYFCNNPGPRSGKIYNLTQASDLKKEKFTSFSHILNKEPTLIMIGKFLPDLELHCYTNTTYRTPIDENLMGSMVTLNCWLNIVTDSFLRRASLLTIFLFGAAMGMIGFLWMLRWREEIKTPMVNLLELAGVLILFSGFTVALFVNWHIKFPFAFSFLAIIRCEQVARWFYSFQSKSKKS